MKLKDTIFFLLFITSIVVNGQNKDDNSKEYPIWIEMMEMPNVNMKEARKSFDDYWKQNTHHKGDKTKKFERWYTINSNRLDQMGNVISAAQVKREFQRLKIDGIVEQKGEWMNYGPINVGARPDGNKRDGGRVKDISFHPVDPETYYVSCFKSGLFKTMDAGNSWKPLTDHLVEEVYTSKLHASSPNTIYIGTNLGVLKSLNDGVTWNATGLPSVVTKALLIKTDDENIVIAGSVSGIYRSTDGGANFTLVKGASKVEDVKIHPTNSNIMYASTNAATSQFYRSIDAGLTWALDTSFGKGGFMKIAVTPAEPNNVYVINARDHLGDDSFEGVYVSTNSGSSFTKRASVTPCITGYRDDGSISKGQPNYNLFITVDPVDPNLIYAGGVKSWKSIDGGVNWVQIYNNVTTTGFRLHLDQLSWAHSPLTKTLFAVNDGGVYYLNSEKKFKSITDGLPIAEVFECTQSQSNPFNVAGGTMHCGVKLNRDGIWYSSWGGDEATVLFDYSDDLYAYHFKYEKISRSKDGGHSFQRINSSSADRGEYTGTGVLDKSDVNTLFIGLFEVERINNARTATSSQVWDKISSFGGNTKIKKIVQSDANHNILYVSRGGGFYRSDNVREANPTFKNVSEGLPTSGTINDIETHPTNANIVYILLGSKVYKSIDKGLNWTNISSGLPNVSLLEMVYDKSSDEGIYIGTDIGVYYKDATLTSWVDYSEGLPAIRVSGMDIYYGATRQSSFLTIATDGRGFWRSELNEISAQTPVVNFSSDKTAIFNNGKVKFINTSTDVQVGAFVWTFEGGIPTTSIESNPIVKYPDIGSYKVSLSYVNNAGTETKSIENYVAVTQLPAPVASFSSDVQNVFAGNGVFFTDSSTGNPTSWEWSFEGGTPANSTEQNPIITYNTTGVYKVVLKVGNSVGEATKEITNYITVTENSGTGTLQAHYNFQGNLKDASSYQRSLVPIGDFNPVFSADRTENLSSAYNAPEEGSKYLSNSYKGIGVNNKRAVTVWFRTTTVGSRKTIISWGKNAEGQMFNVMIDGGTVRIEAGSCSLRSTKDNLDDNEWHHLAVTYDPIDGDKLKDVKIYLDGVLDTNQTDANNSYRSEEVVINTDILTNTMRIGSVNYSDGYIYYGSIDDVRIYSDALSLQEIITIKNSSASVKPVANFTANRTLVFQEDEVQFTDNSVNNVGSWLWTFEKGTPATSEAQNPVVSYLTIGEYKVSLQVTNSKGTDTKEMLNYITVSELLPPIASFSVNKRKVEEREKVVFSDTSINGPSSWEWTFEGGQANSTTVQNPEVTYATEGVYKVLLKASNSKGGNIKEELSYITVTKSLSDILPNDNYTLSVEGETCRNSNNGKVSVEVKSDYEYTAAISGVSINSSLNFNLGSPLNIESLSAGVYNICITVADYPSYKQCFTATVKEPESLSVQSKIDNSKKTILLNLSGSDVYTIRLNNREYRTNEDKINLELDPVINNVIQVSTDKNCQGVYEETIVMGGTPIFYPNPTKNILNVLVAPISKVVTNVTVSVASLTGKVVLSEVYFVSNGSVSVDVSKLEKGVYTIRLGVAGEIVNHKIIKR